MDTRQTQLNDWLKTQFDRPFELTFAAADADYRRYFRATFADGDSVICMDAPPEKMRESVQNYLKVRDLFAHLNVPTVLAKDLEQGFVVLNDLGDTQYLRAMTDYPDEAGHKALLLEAIDELIQLQLASQPNVLPEYDRAKLLEEVNLFPNWFVAKELGKELNFKKKKLWDEGIANLLPVIEAQPKVYVHRDFIVRNLMLTRERVGILDFQDALYGAITYDLVSLLRDAFIEWEEEFVLDLVIRYWEKARAAGLPVHANFDEFYRDFEFMGVQRHLKVAGIFARLWHRDGKDKYRPEIPRFLNYLRRTTRRYHELAPIYALLLELVGDEELQTGYTF
ncbi:N-acetylmuramate/N-acetylglucosamine kinase AmgK [Alysiella crassa]|uniref:Predicted phosphotransferase related to Ser/Thr protein kinases n=1 Tax=Alysiella crassa TaxID=153491 RepID=A0A376BM95_9NEIS|nr:phosphotransferase [Alysiella crassa]UOP07464.1 phosphotransferase [Alysiella crassa]SSY70344.1 Predicted phosphotransferase related to Ser/Thr protein kinases [Alysiella crassa]